MNAKEIVETDGTVNHIAGDELVVVFCDVWEGREVKSDFVGDFAGDTTEEAGSEQVHS